ncbi:MAG TPA: amidohydrolase family protein [Acidimicrobiales bacterium]|nr:amidohydrolase family protein [Acidimicrobiales bacterium]
MPVALRGATVIDGTGADPRDVEVNIRGARIEFVEARAGRSAGTVVDLDGLTLLPGLIDAHTHFGIVDLSEGHTPPAVTAARIFRNCALALEAGFTTVRDTGGIDGGVAAAVDLGLVRGPRILPSGPMLCQTGGHGDTANPFAPFGHHHHYGVPGLVETVIPCDGADQVRLAARTVLRRGATQVKVCVSGGVVSLTDRIEDAQLTVEELMAAVGEADARDTYVTAHAHNVRGIRNGLEAGVQCFEHGTFLDQETAAKMAAAGAYLVPTFAVTRVFAEKAQEWGIPASIVPRMNGMEEAMAGSLKLARDAGIVIGSGSDILGPEQNRRGLELVIRSQLGDPMEAIVSATANNSRVLRRHDDLGTVEAGKLADLIAVDFDPLRNPELFDDPSRVRLVLKGGETVKDTR